LSFNYGGILRLKTFLIAGIVALLMMGGLVVYLFLMDGGKGEALAIVNGEEVSAAQLTMMIEKLEEPSKSMFKEDPAQLLDVVIMKTLLLQEIKAQGFSSQKGSKDADALIEEFLEAKFSKPPAVSQEEIKAFYDTHKERMEGKTLEELSPVIEQVLGQGKLEGQYTSFLEGLREKADIKIFHDRLKAIAVKPPDSNSKEDFMAALRSGRPLLVDFGSNTCIPCRQLRPILQEIKQEQTGKMEVLVIDVYKYRDLAQQYKVQVIPTIVLFDASGKEAFRGQGFMPKEAIMEQIRKMEAG
jgi:thioredoxin 1